MKVPAIKTSSPSTPDAQSVVTIMLMAVVSNTGYVCDAQIIRGLDKETDKRAVQAVRSWRFQPGQKDGHPVPTVITVQVTYRKDGELVQPIITPSQDELQH